MGCSCTYVAAQLVVTPLDVASIVKESKNMKQPKQVKWSSSTIFIYTIAHVYIYKVEVSCVKMVTTLCSESAITVGSSRIWR